MSAFLFLSSHRRRLFIFPRPSRIHPLPLLAVSLSRDSPTVSCRCLQDPVLATALIYIRFGSKTRPGVGPLSASSSAGAPARFLGQASRTLSRGGGASLSSYVTPLSHLGFCISLEILHSMLGCGWGGYRVWSPTPDDAGVGGGGKQWVGLGAGSWRMTRRDSCSTAAALASGPCCAGELDSVRPLLRSSL